MALRTTRLLSLAALAAALVLGACSREKGEEKLASLGNDADPQLTSALNDQILVDPNLADQSNRNAVRPPATTTKAQYPQGGPEGTAQPAAPAGCNSGAKFDYNMSWANRLAPEFPVYPGAKVTEAAGNDANGCGMRVVSFSTGDDLQRVLDWYHTRAVHAGYTSEHQLRGTDDVLAGSNERTGGAFYLVATRTSGGAEASLISNKGR
jgi:hypothetical protein